MINRSLMITILILIIIPVVLGSYICFKRISIEKENAAVEIIIDYADVENLALSEGISTSDVLKKFRDIGATSVAITENTLVDHEKEGSLSISPGYTLNSKAYKPDRIYLFNVNKSIKNQLIRGLETAFGNKNIGSISGAVEVSGTMDDIFLKGTGLSPKKIKLVESAGLRVIPRLKNSYSLNKDAIERSIMAAKKLADFDTVIFDGEEVLGYPNYIKETSLILKHNKIKYGYIELAKQNGDSSLLNYCDMNSMNIHSIPADEIGTLTRTEVIQRFLRAVQDRNIRMLYLHAYPYPEKGKGILNSNLDIMRELRSKLEKRGFYPYKASVPGNISTDKVRLSVLSLGVTAAAFLLFAYFIDLSIPIFIVFTILTIIALLILPNLIIQKIFALIAAVIFPVFAIISQYPAAPPKPQHKIVLEAVFIVLYMVGITFLGCVLITGLLGDRSFMMGINKFSGVKIALLLPVLLVASCLFIRDENGKLSINESVKKIRDIMDIKITVINVFLVLSGFFIIGLLLLRSGNFGMPVMFIEKIFRGSLENLMIIRPRTKEFIIGYPALLLGTIYYLKGGKKWLPVWAALGILALVSMTNTFCHVHSPLTVTILRSVYGLFIGLLLGLLFYGLYSATISVIYKFIRS